MTRISEFELSTTNDADKRIVPRNVVAERLVDDGILFNLECVFKFDLIHCFISLYFISD
jgi:hypothetical protein